MKALNFLLDNSLRVMVIPDLDTQSDPETIITHTDSVFRDDGLQRPLTARSEEDILHLQPIDDPGYYGFVTFERPGSLFSYTADGQLELTSEEVTELIEHLSHVRDNPALWDKPYN